MDLRAYAYTNRGGRPHNEDSLRASAEQGIFVLADGLGGHGHGEVASALAVDIDPKAVDVAYENAALNGIGKDRYTVRAGDILTDTALAAEIARQRYPLVLANIVADVIIPLSTHVPDLLTQDGIFLCSGIIDTRAHEVEAALERNGLKIIKKREKNGWVALEAVLA